MHHLVNHLPILTSFSNHCILCVYIGEVKIIPFTIPVPDGSSIHVQHEALPAFYPHLHRHKEWQITAILKGTGTLLAGNVLIPFEPGQLFVFGAQLPHVFKSDLHNNKTKRKQIYAEAYSVFFSTDAGLQSLLALPEMRSIDKWLNKYQAGCCIQGKQTVALTELLQQVVKEEGAKRLSSLIALLHGLTTAKSPLAFGGSQRVLSDAAGQRINNVIQYTLQHYTGHIAIADVARTIHMTPQAFCRYFKQHTRKTYINFVTELRIQEACKLLQQAQTENVSAVAWQTGFNSVPNFNRVFKKVTGTTPGLYAAKFKTF